MTVSAPLRMTGKASSGGEQAANTLQPEGTSQHATTLDAKVRDVIEALRLV